MKEITVNKKAYHDYEIIDKYEAGIVLTGPEIKAIRAGKVNLTGSHGRLIQDELFLINMHVSILNEDPTKTRKLLMHKSEINKLIGKTQQKGLTLIPLRLYLKNGRAKIELGLGRGEKLHDKRETIKKRDIERSRKRGEE